MKRPSNYNLIALETHPTALISLQMVKKRTTYCYGWVIMASGRGRLYHLWYQQMSPGDILLTLRMYIQAIEHGKGEKDQIQGSSVSVHKDVVSRK